MLQVDECSLKERFGMKYLHQESYLRDTYGVDKHNVCLVFCIACICELPQDITMFMWTTIVHSLSQVTDHPMSSPCWVDRAGHVLAYLTVHSNDVAFASSPMISLLDIIRKYSTHLV